MAKKVTEQRLMNVALFHLRRFSPSVTGMRRVLDRRIYKWTRDGAEVAGDAKALVAAVLARLQANGYLDDARLAQTKLSSLRRGGTSARVISLKLRKAGLSQEHVASAKAQDTTDDASAVWTWARRKRLGVFRTKQRTERREKDLAALVRAGFSFRDARMVVDADEADVPTP
jgi:regulatory protein